MSEKITSDLINPFKRLRLSESWSQEQVSESVPCNKNLVIRTEQGCYANPPPVLLDWFLDKFPVGDRSLLAEYHLFQTVTRAKNYGLLPDDLNVLYRSNAFKNPITTLRGSRNLSKAQISIGLCIHPVIIHKMEKQPHLCKNLPKQFVDALVDAGYSVAYVEELKEFWKDYKHLLGSEVVTRAG